MFDFPIKESSVGTSLYCLFFYLAIIFTNYKYGLKFPFTRSVSSRKIKWTLFFIGFFFITHCLKGDFFHMMEHVYDYSSIPGAYNFGEEIYPKIGLFVGKNYFLFRTVVWGGAFVLFCLTARKMDIPVYYAAVLLLATHSIIFCYARATAAMAVYFFGLSFLCKPLNNKWWSYVIGLFVIILSCAFHRSAIIMVIMTIMILIPIQKRSILLLFIALPILSVVFKNILMAVALSESTDEILSNKIQSYSEREINHGVSGLIIMFLEYGSFYIPAILTAMSIFINGNMKKIPTEVFLMFKVALGLVMVSILFLFMGSSYVTFVYRMLFMSMIPLTLVIVKLYKCNIMNHKYLLVCIYSGIAYCLVRYVYTIYDIYVNSPI